MTVAIKGIDEAGGCGVCSGLCKDVYPYICYRCDIEFTEAETNLIIDLPGLTSKKCKLVALPEENKDMSWEELVEKVKALNLKDSIFREDICFAIPIVNDKWEFFKGGDITDWGSIGLKTKQTPFQMWQIIQALVGER